MKKKLAICGIFLCGIATAAVSINSKIKNYSINFVADPDNLGGGKESQNIADSGKNLDSKEINKTFSAEQNRKYRIATSVEDNATNKITNTESIRIKIDKTPPNFVAVQLQQFDSLNSPAFRNLSSALSNFEAHESFKLKLEISDPNFDDDFGSGIDWARSTIKISKDGNVELTETPIENLSGSEINFSAETQIITFEDATDIFEKSGEYILNFHFQDKAKNNATGGGISADGNFLARVNIVASEISDSTSTLEKIANDVDSDCLDSNAMANFSGNNFDYFCYKFLPKDRFSNPIKSRNFFPQIIGESDEEQNDFSTKYIFDFYDDDGNNYQNFLDGLRLATEKNFSSQIAFDGSTKILSGDGDKRFFLASYSPTLSVQKIGPENEGFLKTSQIASKNIKFSFDIFDVNFNGTEKTTKQKIYFQKNVEFSPWIKTFLKVNESENGEVDLITGDENEIFAKAETSVQSDLKKFPANFSVYLIGYDPDEYGKKGGFLEENISDNSFEAIIENFEDTAINSTNYNDNHKIETRIMAGETENLDEEDKILLGTKIEINSNGKTIIYPENDDNKRTVEAFEIGADFEGYVMQISNQTESSGNNRTRMRNNGSEVDAATFSKNIGIIDQNTDYRKIITENAWRLISKREADGGNENNILNIENMNKNIYFFEGDLKLTGSEFTGVRTIIIKDGNLLISENFKYKKDTDSLGVILINSVPTPQPNTGNIFIKNDVKKFVGTYFLDGTITSTIKNDLNDLPGNISEDDDLMREENSDLQKQLLLTGSFFPRNTWGGATDKENSGEFKLPWQKTTTNRILAQKYDLNYVRRYDGSGVPNCVKKSNGNCIENPNAFVIKIDEKAKNFPPPGFEISEKIGN